MSSDRCIDCGRPEDEHHEFKRAVIPANCKCDPSDWGNPLAIPAVCDEYREKPQWGTCGVCDHDRECHSTRPSEILIVENDASGAKGSIEFSLQGLQGWKWLKAVPPETSLSEHAVKP